MVKGIFHSSIGFHWTSRQIKPVREHQSCFMAELLQNEGNVMLVKVNEIQTILKYPKPMFIGQ